MSRTILLPHRPPRRQSRDALPAELLWQLFSQISAQCQELIYCPTDHPDDKVGMLYQLSYSGNFSLKSPLNVKNCPFPKTINNHSNDTQFFGKAKVSEFVKFKNFATFF